MTSKAAMQTEQFEREVSSLLPHLYGAALRFARNAEDAEDLVAESVAKAWTALPTLQEPTRFRGWIFRILTNTFYAQCRTRASQPLPEPLPAEDSDEFSLFERLHRPFLLWWSNPEQQYLDRLLRADLERAVDALPDPYRMTVVLADLQGLTYAEVSTVLAVPVGTVRSRLARGRSMLQKALWEHGLDAGLVADRKHQEPTEHA